MPIKVSHKCLSWFVTHILSSLSAGATVPNGELSNMMSIPVQCTQEIPVYFHEKPQPLAAAAHNPAAQCGIDCLTRNVGTFSNLLAEDMAKLSVDMPHQRKEDGMLAQKAAPLLSLDSLRLPGASSNESKTPSQADRFGRDRTRTTWVGVFT